MSTQPTFVKGFIPSPDVIRNSLGPIAGNVFGVVWMYNQMRSRECFADIKTISANSGFGTTATRAALRDLEGAGWVDRVERKGKTAVYRDTGRWSMAIVGEEVPPTPAPTTEAEMPATPTPDVSPGPLPQRQTLPTPTPRVAPPTPRVGLPQRVALPNIQEKQTTKQTRQQTEEGSRTSAPSRTRPAPKPEPRRQTAPSPSSSSPIDPADEMQAAILEACGLDPDLTRAAVLVSVADFAHRLKARKFTPAEVRDAGEAWPECFPDRDPEDVEPPHPQQLAEWVGRRRAAEAMRKAAGSKGERRTTATNRRMAPAFHGIVPMIER